MITTLTAFLVPCLPFLLEKVSSPVLESIGAKIGESTWEKGQAIWATLFPKLEQDPATKMVAAELVKNPESEIWKAAFQEKLQALLDGDEQLKQMIAEILKDEEAPIAGTSIQMNVENNQGQMIGQMTGGEAKNIGSVKNIQGDINF